MNTDYKKMWDYCGKWDIKGVEMARKGQGNLPKGLANTRWSFGATAEGETVLVVQAIEDHSVISNH